MNNQIHCLSNKLHPFQIVYGDTDCPFLYELVNKNDGERPCILYDDKITELTKIVDTLNSSSFKAVSMEEMRRRVNDVSVEEYIKELEKEGS